MVASEKKQTPPSAGGQHAHKLLKGTEPRWTCKSRWIFKSKLEAAKVGWGWPHHKSRAVDPSTGVSRVPLPPSSLLTTRMHTHARTCSTRAQADTYRYTETFGVDTHRHKPIHMYSGTHTQKHIHIDMQGP